MTMQDHATSCGTKSDHTGIYETIYVFSKSYGTILDHTKPYMTRMDHRWPYGIIRNLKGPCGTMYDRVGFYRTIHEHTGQYWTIGDHTGSYQVIIFILSENAVSYCKFSTMSHTNRISALRLLVLLTSSKIFGMLDNKPLFILRLRLEKLGLQSVLHLDPFQIMFLKRNYVKPSQHCWPERLHNARAAEEGVIAASPCVVEEAVSERINSDIVSNEASNHEYPSNPTEADQVLLEVKWQVIKDEKELIEISI